MNGQLVEGLLFEDESELEKFLEETPAETRNKLAAYTNERGTVIVWLLDGVSVTKRLLELNVAARKM